MCQTYQASIFSLWQYDKKAKLLCVNLRGKKLLKIILVQKHVLWNIVRNRFNVIYYTILQFPNCFLWINMPLLIVWWRFQWINMGRNYTLLILSYQLINMICISYISFILAFINFYEWTVFRKQSLHVIH